MPAPKGNRFWEVRSSHGRKPIFSSPDQLWDAATQYFQWVEDNPLWSSKTVNNQGVPLDLPEAKMRAMTIQGLCLFLDISEVTWRDWRTKEDFSFIVSQIERVIYQQKLTGAAADLLNSNIIARELGLSDKKETKATIALEDLPDVELESRIQALENLLNI